LLKQDVLTSKTGADRPVTNKQRKPVLELNTIVSIGLAQLFARQTPASRVKDSKLYQGSRSALPTSSTLFSDLKGE
jgi:hypothetical protein